VAVRFLLDENLPERLVQAIAQRFPRGLHVRALGLGGATDLLLWDRAVVERCVLVTKDEDFVKLSVLRGPPPKVVWLNVGNAGTAVIAALLLQHAEAIEEFEAHPELGFLALRLAPQVA
jgi:predicted nuclease of predicted toxin-antitoxin system